MDSRNTEPTRNEAAVGTDRCREPLDVGHSCGRQSCLAIVPASGLSGRRSALAIHGAQWGRQSCLQPPFRRLANPEHWRSQRFFGVMFCRYRDGKPEKFVKGRASWLKAGCTVESLALPVHPVCDAAASSRIKETVGALYLGEVSSPFMGRRPMRTARIGCPTKEPKAERRPFRPPSRYASNFPCFAGGCLRNTKPEKYLRTA